MPEAGEPDDRRAELALEVADLDDRLEALDADGSAFLGLLVPAVAVAALGTAAVVGFRMLGPYLFTAWTAVTVAAFAAIVRRTRTLARAERAALEKERALLTARLVDAEDRGPDASDKG